MQSSTWEKKRRAAEEGRKVIEEEERRRMEEEERRRVEEARVSKRWLSVESIELRWIGLDQKK